MTEQEIVVDSDLTSNDVEDDNFEQESRDPALQDWSKQYDALIQNPPGEGDILGSADDSKAVLVIELKEKAPPFVYGRAYVPEIVGSKLGWHLQSAESQGFHGWKCILMPRARTELIQRSGLQAEIVEITSLKVIRHSKSGKSLLCEVHEY